MRTNGILLKTALTQIAVIAQLPGSRVVQRRAADRLVELNLWEEKGGHWSIHDFAEFGPPKRFLRHDERGADHGTRGTRHDESGPVPLPVPDPLEDFSKEVTSDGEDAA